MRRDIKTRLEYLGYECRTRGTIIFEAFVVGHGGQWKGLGNSAESALEHAASQMPAHAPRPRPTSWPEPADGGQEAEPEGAEAQAVRLIVELRQRFDQLWPALCVSSRERIRHQLLAWVCEARDIEHQHPESFQVRDQVHALTATIGLLSSALWPGNLPALRLEATPFDVARVLHDSVIPANWAHAAQLCREALDRDTADPLTDEWGWTDAKCLTPPPRRPDELFRQTCTRVESVLGRLDERNGRGLEHHLAKLEKQTFADLVTYACCARWLRRTGQDPELWGRLVGRMRWAARRTGSIELRHALETDTKPWIGDSWSALVRDRGLEA